MEQRGTVPAGTAAKVRDAAAGKLDPAKILEIEATTRHDVIAFLTHVEQLAGEPARWLHLGMTSSDVLDTCLALQTGRALEKIVQGVMGLANVLRDKAREHAKTPTIGRSHGIHAEPITAGLVFARWHAEVVRALNRIIRARHTLAVGKIAGAVGVYGHLDPDVERVAMPDATILADFMTARATGLVKGLIVHERRMKANLEKTGGLYFSEAVLLALVKTGLPRQEAYVLVQKAALAAIAEAAQMG